MKIGNITIKFHKHKWEKQVIYAQENLSAGSDGYLYKFAEKCMAKDCDAGCYKSFYYVRFRAKPEILSID